MAVDLNRTDTNRPLPPGWRWVRLGEVSDIASGVTLGRKVANATRPVPYLRVANVKDGHLDLSDVYEIEATDSEIEKYRLKYGDLLLTEGGDPDKLGRGTFWKEEISECIHQNHIFRVRLKLEQFSPEFLAYLISSPHGKNYFLANSKRTTGIATINRKVLGAFPILAPPLPEQKRIAAILTEQMAAVERARVAAEAQLEAAKALPAAHLRAIFNSPEAQKWPWRCLSEFCELLPAKSVALNSDTEVEIITTACLTESGFDASGIRKSRMWKVDYDKCVVSSGEVLIARSNTIDLVGRVAMYEGEPVEAAATDLTIRIWPTEGLRPQFLSSYLSSLYLTGYWKNHASGASGSMKKIRREQILKLKIPVPPTYDQDRTVKIISERMAAVRRTQITLTEQLCQIEKLPAALLRRAFNGEL